MEIHADVLGDVTMQALGDISIYPRTSMMQPSLSHLLEKFFPSLSCQETT